jgi:hypothetical protein
MAHKKSDQCSEKLDENAEKVDQIAELVTHRSTCDICEFLSDKEVWLKRDKLWYTEQHSMVKNGKCLKKKFGQIFRFCEEDTRLLEDRCQPCHLELLRIQYHHYADPKHGAKPYHHPLDTNYPDDPYIPVREFDVPWSILQTQEFYMEEDSEVGPLPFLIED